MRETVRREILPNVWMTSTRTDSYRTGFFSVLLVTELKRDTAAKNALLPRVLRRGTAEYPDVRAVSEALDGLYGGEISPVAVTWGELQGVGFVSRFCDDTVLPGKPGVTEKMIRLVGGMLLDPVTRGGMLLSEYVESEREKLVDAIRAAVNQKTAYAKKQLLSQMCQGERYAVGRLGEEAQACTIGYQGLTKHYRRVLSQARVEISLCSSMGPGEAMQLVTEIFAAIPRRGGEIKPTQILYAPKREKPRVFRETMPVAQGRLVMGFRLGEWMQRPDHGVIAVFEKLFGGSPASRLFRALRQEKGLCYSVKAQLDHHKGVMLVYAGTDAEKLNDAAEEIRLQLKKLCDGDFPEEALDGAKREVRNEILSMGDAPMELCFRQLELTMLELSCTPEEFAGLADCVTREQIMAFAAGIREDAVYLLSGEAEEP